MSLRKRRVAQASDEDDSQSQRRRFLSGPIILLVTIIILAAGSIEIVATIRNYALSLAELHALQRDEQSLKDRKNSLLNDVGRWKDKAYVTTQARDRLGFVFPDELAVRVEHPEAVTGVAPNKYAQGNVEVTNHKPLPWYSDLMYKMHKIDKPNDNSSSAAALEESIIESQNASLSNEYSTKKH